MARSKPQPPIVQNTGSLTPQQAYQLEVQRGLRSRARYAAVAARMGGPQRPITPSNDGGTVVVDKNGLVQSPFPALKTQGFHQDPGFGPQDPAKIRMLQQFLANRGYKIQVDGINGPLTRAAAEDFRTNRHPDAFNVAHKLGGPATPTPKAAATSPAHTGAGQSGITGGGNAGGYPGSGITDLLSAMLKGANTSNLIPTSLAGDAASPYTALAAQLQQEIGNLPTAKANALANIANWFGQVTGAEKTAASRDKTMADAGAAADASNTKGIIASLGGSAMGGSGEIGAMGANDANTLSAIGASDQQLSSDLAPLFASEEANAKTTMSNKFDQGLQDLNAQLASAQGQGAAAKAAALMQIIGANNASRDSNFKNTASLLQTLAGLQISGANAASNAQYKTIENQLHSAEAKKAAAEAVSKTGPFGTLTQLQRQTLANNITKGMLDSSGKLSVADWPTALRNARNSVRQAGLDPFNSQVINTIIGPALANAGIGGPGGSFWQAIYQP